MKENGKFKDEMDPKLFDFIKTKVNSFIKWELVRFFYDNPHTVDSANNIALHNGRKVSQVKLGLEALVEIGLLEKSELAEEPLYRLTSAGEMRSLTEEFGLAFEDRLFRKKAVAHITPGMR